MQSLFLRVLNLLELYLQWNVFCFCLRRKFSEFMFLRVKSEIAQTQRKIKSHVDNVLLFYPNQKIRKKKKKQKSIWSILLQESETCTHISNTRLSWCIFTFFSIAVIYTLWHQNKNLSCFFSFACLVFLPFSSI